MVSLVLDALEGLIVTEELPPQSEVIVEELPLKSEVIDIRRVVSRVAYAFKKAWSLITVTWSFYYSR